MPAIGALLASIVAKMGMTLLTEAVVKRVAVATLRALEDKARKNGHKSIGDAVDAIADAWEV